MSDRDWMDHPEAPWNADFRPETGKPRRARGRHVVPPSQEPLTEAGAAERFARLHGNTVRFDHRRKRWLVWDRHRWRPDADEQVMRLGLAFARAWKREATEIRDADRSTATWNFAHRFERRQALASMLQFAAAMKPIADAGDGWDSDPWLLGCPNGIVDLRTGALRDGTPDDRITMNTSVPYEPEASSALWCDTLAEVLGEEDVINFLHVAAGYSATGDTRRDCWFLAFGTGRNGKGTVLHPIGHALGDYAMELPAAIFNRRCETMPYDLAILPGKRFVRCSESGDTVVLNHDRIKQLSGGDPLRAANKYERSFEFNPVCKLWLSANRKPRVSDDSPAFWCRLLTVPFRMSFAGRENRTIRPALEQEPEHQAAILAWVVRGAIRYAREGLDAPDAVSAATDEYARESDPLADFVAEALESEPESEVRASEMYDHYLRWATRHALTERERLTATKFGMRMHAKYGTERRERGIYYLDVARRPLDELISST